MGGGGGAAWMITRRCGTGCVWMTICAFRGGGGATRGAPPMVTEAQKISVPLH